MKKIILFLICILSIYSLSACKKQEQDKIRILTPSGMPALTFGTLFDDDSFEFTVVDGASMLSSELTKGEYDVIVAPVILGAQLYSKGNNKYQLASVITTNNLYIVSRSEDVLTNLKDLEGETIASFGENTAPDIMLKATLEINGVDIKKVNFVYENSVSDAFVNRFMNTNPTKYVLSSEPVITKMNQKAFKDSPLNVIDLSTCSNLFIVQAGLFVRTDKSFNFMSKIENNINRIYSDKEHYVKDLMNLKSEHVNIFTTITESVILSIIDNCGIKYYKASINKNLLDSYFNAVNKYNSKILNGQQIDENFYI